MNGSEILIKATNLHKHYKLGSQTVAAVKGIDLEIKRGEFVALVGASGSGKSTLLHLLGGLDAPTSGSVEINGVNLAKLSDAKLSELRNQTIGFIFQSFYLQPFLTVQENLEIPSIFARRDAKARANYAKQLAKIVGLENRLQHRPRELSGGETQRIAIARALMNKPQIILADEPTGNLDSKNSDLIIRILESINRNLGTTIVLITHNPEIANRAKRQIQLKDGEIIHA